MVESFIKAISDLDGDGNDEDSVFSIVDVDDGVNEDMKREGYCIFIIIIREEELSSK